MKKNGEEIDLSKLYEIRAKSVKTFGFCGPFPLERISPPVQDTVDQISK